MNRILASTAALLALVGSAYAAQTEGTVQSVDPATRLIVLDTGATFTAAEDVTLDGIAAGAKVKITYDEGSTTATAVEAAM